MSSRDAILTSIKKSLQNQSMQKNGDDPLQYMKSDDDWFEKTFSHSYAGHHEIVQEFCQKAQDHQTDIAHFDKEDDILPYLNDYVADKNIAKKIWVEKHLSFHDEVIKKYGFSLKKPDADDDDIISIRYCYKAIAETGTLMLISGKDKESLMNFLPKTSMVLVKESDIIACYEQGWRALKKEYNHDLFPRNVHFVTGPSRTGDIAQKIELGAHGPLNMLIGVIHDSR